MRRPARARTVTDFCGELVRDDPDHFGFFATRALPNTEASLDEARYALDDLGADGIVLLSNVDATYVGSPRWDPLLDLLDERETVLFIHPTTLPGPLLQGVSPGAVDHLAASTRAAANLLVHDSLRRNPPLRISIAHGGGYVPYAAARTASMLSRDADEADVLEQLRPLLVRPRVDRGPVRAAIAAGFAHPGHITVGSNCPY